MRIALVHGFNVNDGGKNTVDKLAPYAEAAGYTVDRDEADYGFFNIWMVRLVRSKLRSRVLYRLAKAFEKADVIITHSNGANFTTQALQLLDHEHNNTKLVIHISPALDRDTPIPLAVKSQAVFFTPNDFMVKLSSWLPFHPWGRMGARGYSGDDNRNRNFKSTEIEAHSAWFNIKHAAITWDKCDCYINRKK